MTSQSQQQAQGKDGVIQGAAQFLIGLLKCKEIALQLPEGLAGHDAEDRHFNSGQNFAVGREHDAALHPGHFVDSQADIAVADADRGDILGILPD